MYQIDTLTIFGINPEVNTHKGELQIRLQCLRRVLSATIPKTMVFLGGDTWSEGGHLHSEAEFIASKAREEFPELLPARQIELSEGLETTAQTHALLDYMHTAKITPEKIGVISSWHQLLRTGPIFLLNEHRLPQMYPVFESEGPAALAYDISINAIAGVGYTMLSEILRSNPRFNDGGPIIRRINEERTKKDGYSWFNTMR